MLETTGRGLRVAALAFTLGLGPLITPGACEDRGDVPEECAEPLQWLASAEDTPNDNGSSLTIRWMAAGDVPQSTPVRILRQAEGDTALCEMGRAKLGDGTYEDKSGLERGRRYRYRLLVPPGSGLAHSAETMWVAPTAQWFDGGGIAVAIAISIFCLLVLVCIIRARRGADVFIRRIPGLEAVDEAIGRATEMGKPIVFSPGIDEVDQPGTIAGLAILGNVVERAAANGTRTIVPNRDPVVMTVTREIGREACLVAGRPELYRDEDFYYATYSQFGYAATVAGTMVRERPAVNFFMGNFAGEALILAETGYSTGAMQIAGCDADTQLPFFITTCDYTLIGEELYAAAGYLSRDPVLLGSLKGQDVGKLILIAGMIAGVVLAVLGVDIGSFLK
ncbi:MAG: hypothetical protein KAW17_00485 [Candidatus Eisenbacteria sp.]|nr:hypothetical protein [Candidatus Eisenbacteria bacterium]